MNLNYPHREALVVRNHELRVMRRLSGNPDVRARAGERVTADQVLARVDASASAIKLPISDQLGIAPHDVNKCLMRPVGSTFSTGEALARARKGLRNVVFAAPVAGTLIAVDPSTGVGLLAPGSGGEIRSLITGDIEFVDGRNAISIRTVGSRLLGAVGVGDATTGPLRMLVTQPGEEAQPGRITNDLVSGKVVVIGSWATSAVLKKLFECRAAALICGGLVEREIATALNLQVEDRLAPWRLAGGDRAMGENLPPTIPIMATEGFGQATMHPDAFALLKESEGRQAVLFPYTRITGELTRPELIIPDDISALDDDGLSSQAAFIAGARIRLTDQATLGKAGTLLGSPRRSRTGDGLVLDVVDVELVGGANRTVPIANVEIVA